MKKEYYVKEYARGRWHVIGPSGFPIYDDEPYGNDKPVIFHDEDAGFECAERCNLELNCTCEDCGESLTPRHECSAHPRVDK